MTNPSWYQITVSREKYTDTAEKLGQWFNEHGARDWAIGNETGMDGYKHFQIVVHFKKGVSEKSIHEWFGPIGHVSVSHEHNFEYAMKTGDYITSWKDVLAKYKNMNLLSWQAEVIGILGAQSEREILCLVDLRGNTGKSILGKWLEANKILDVCPVISEEYNDYTGYCMEYPREGYMFDLPRCISTRRMMALWSGIETIKNGLLFEKRNHPRKMWIEPPKIIVSTNHWPPVDALSKDRWQIYQIVTDTYGDNPTGPPRLKHWDVDEIPKPQVSPAGKPCNTETC